MISFRPSAAYAILLVAGCDTAPPPSAATKASGDDRTGAPTAVVDRSSPIRSEAPPDDSPPEFSLRIVDGRLLVHTRVKGAEPTLVRSAAWRGSTIDKDAETQQLERELTTYVAWKEATARRVSATSSNAELHDALLEIAERLEPVYESDREHLGILRDLTTAYVRLLALEGDSPLGAKLCVLAARRLAEFERPGRPPEDVDAQWAKQIRARLHFHMHQYPQAAKQGDDATSALLGAIGQKRFLTTGLHREGRRQIRTYRTLDEPPAAELLWEEMHYTVSEGDDSSPDEIRTYCLVRQGAGADVRWYLDAYFLNRSMLVRLYGSERPKDETVLQDVRDRLKQDFPSIQ